jgi:ABC-type siderophore export system fused ATPase/permease subunit
LLRLDLQLETFIDDMRKAELFKGLNNLVDLSVKLVETKRDKVYHWVYLLIKLVLLLLVATASVERIFSTMTFIKIKLRNKMGDRLLDDCPVTFIEQDIFLQLSE